MEIEQLYWVVFVLFLHISKVICDQEDDVHATSFMLEGKATVQGVRPQDWIKNAKISVDGHAYSGYFRSDGSFEVHGIPTGSYIVEIASPDYIFESARVDITSKGKVRARKTNFLQASSVVQLQYPLRLKSKMKPNYFQKRETWRVTDFLMNPMIIMMLVTCFLVVLLPKMVNNADPETQKEMQQSMNMFSNPGKDLPEISEFFTWMFPNDKKKAVAAKSKSQKRR